MNKALWTLALASLLVTGLAGCLSGEETTPDTEDAEPTPWHFVAPEPTPTAEPEPLDPDTQPGLRFIAIGDMGTGEEGQYQVAAAMQAVCEARGCDFVLGLGDNIYESGVSDEYDPQFDSKFEMPYANLTEDWYLTLGNHDNSHDPVTTSTVGDQGAGQWYASGDAEVAYSYRTDRASEKWHLPARYYDMARDNVTFFSLDSNTLMFYGQAFPPTDLTFQQQEAWIDEAIAAADTPWKIAFAHHPYRSNGEHGNAGEYDGTYPTPVAGPYVKQFYEDHICGKVDILLTGHDHDLEWLAPVESCGGTEFIVSGAGAKTRDLADPERNEAYFQQGGTLGFVWIEVVGDTFTGVIYDGDGDVLFERSLVKGTETQ